MERRRGSWFVTHPRRPRRFPDIPPASAKVSQLPGGLARGGYRKARPDRSRQARGFPPAASTRLVRALESRQDRRESAMDRLIAWLTDGAAIAAPHAGPQRFQARQRHARLRQSGPRRSRTGLGDGHRGRPSGGSRPGPMLLVAAERPRRREVIHHIAARLDHARRTGCALRSQNGPRCSRIAYYHVFALFKLAAVLQQIFVRFHRGQTQDERFRHFIGVCEI